jgi:deoxyribodipyrimidine photolyase-related protein
VDRGLGGPLLAFVHDHREVFEANPRSRMMTRLWDGFEDDRQAEHLERA